MFCAAVLLQCCCSDGDLHWIRVNKQKCFADVASMTTIVIIIIFFFFSDNSKQKEKVKHEKRESCSAGEIK